MRLGAVAFFLFFPFAQTGSAVGIQICLSLAAAVVLCAYPGGYSPSIRDYYLRQPHRIVLLAVPIALATLVSLTKHSGRLDGDHPPPPPRGFPLPYSWFPASATGDPSLLFPFPISLPPRHNVGPKTCP